MPEKKIKLTKEMTDKIHKQLKEMEGQEIKHDTVIDLSPDDLAWYVAYKTGKEV